MRQLAILFLVFLAACVQCPDATPPPDASIILADASGCPFPDPAWEETCIKAGGQVYMMATVCCWACLPPSVNVNPTCGGDQ